jgi:DNA-binding HxlR family transcriptional regulator
MLILRNAFYGMRSFDGFQKQLGISPSVLSQRLRHLIEEGILTKNRCPNDGRQFEYRLTEAALELYPVLIALMQWGEKWRPNPEGPRIILKEKVTDRPVRGVFLLSEEGKCLSARDVKPFAGPGADELTQRLIGLRHQP